MNKNLFSVMPRPEKKENNGGGGLNAAFYLEGCGSKSYKLGVAFTGVESVVLDPSSGKITVNGKADPVALREKREEKTHKKVELPLLPSPVKMKDKENAKEKGGSGDGKADKKKDANGKGQKTPKEPPVTTAVFKVRVCCDGCIDRIRKIVSTTKGFEGIKIDKEKDLVTVKGAMDMKSLAEKLKKELKRDVEIVPPEKDKINVKANAEGGGGGGGGGTKVVNNVGKNVKIKM